MVRRGVFGYLLARFVIIPLFVLGFVAFVLGCFALLFWLAAQPSSSSPVTPTVITQPYAPVTVPAITPFLGIS